MKDLSLYGSLIIDTIFDVNGKEGKTTKDIGGMINTWLHFNKINKNGYTINVCPLYFGEAFVVYNTVNCERYGRGNLNLRKYNIKEYHKCKWSHLMYLNYLNMTKEEMSKISDKSEIISADLCIGKKINPELLKYIDYLFVSEDEYEHFGKEYVENIRGYIIMHSPTGSKIINNGDTNKKTQIITEDELNKEGITILKNVNVTGAGDFFAAAFIYDSLHNINKQSREDTTILQNIKQSLLYAHKSVYEKLLEQISV